MLNYGKEAKILGFRYPVVLGVLLLIGVLAASGLLVELETLTSLDSWRAPLRSLAAILAVALSAAAWISHRYFAAAQHLADVRATSKAILESLAGGVLTFDNEARMTFVNRAAARILELPSHAPYPPIKTFASRHPALAEYVRRALQEEDYCQDEDHGWVNSEGRSIILRTTVSAQNNEEGDRIGLIALVKDVSSIVALEQELRKRDRLAAAGSLAAGVAHEIRNPLSAVDLNLRLLKGEVDQRIPRDDDGEIDDYFEILSLEVSRLSGITSKFLQLSRPDTLCRSKIRFRDPVLQVVRLLEPEAREKGIRFHVDIDSANVEIMGEAAKLEQVWLNILINAMQSMPAGGEIRLAGARQSDGDREWVMLRIEDQGAGVVSENIDRLFDPYFTTRPEGTGLGLAIADRIVADHGGTIAVESVPGHGSAFTVRLPAPSLAEQRGSR